MKNFWLQRLLFLLGTLAWASPAWAQLDLSTLGTNYLQDFNTIESGVPTGWQAYSNATATTLGTSAAINIAKTSWSTSGLNNYASTIGNGGVALTGGETSTQQGAVTNRALGVRPIAGTDPGAALVLQLANTANRVDFKLAFDFLMLSVQTRSNLWLLQYAVGNTPTNFTTVAVFTDNSVFGATHTNISFENALDNRAENVWIRLATLTASTGSGTRDTIGLDNFSLSWTTGTTSVTNPPSIVNQSGNAVAVVGASPTLTVAPSGTPPFTFQWYKDGVPLADGGNVSGANTNTLTFTSVLHSNAGSYRLAISNAVGYTNSAPISLVVTGFVMQRIFSTNTLAGVPVTGIPLGFVDPLPGISYVSATSDNQILLPDAAISVTGSNTNRAVTLSPSAGKSGVAVVTVTASDGSFSTNTSFAVVVVPDTNVVFNDFFDYGDGSLDVKSAFLWRNHSGNAGETQVTNHQLAISQSLGEDVNAWFTRPYLTNTAAVVYSGFTVIFTDLPNAAGTYFAHFKDDSTTRFRGLVWASTTGAAAGKFRLGVVNGTSGSATTAQFPQDLDTNVAYAVVTRLDVDSVTTSFWLNPTNESDTHVTASDSTTGPLSIFSYAFRQQSGEGKLLVDDLVIGDTYEAVTAKQSAPPVLQVQRTGSSVVLTWSDNSFALQSANTVTGQFNPVVGAASPYTNVISGARQFFRLSK